MRLTRPVRQLAIAAAVTITTALGVPAAARAALATGQAPAAPMAVPAADRVAQYLPGRDEWWLAQWQVPQQVWPLTEGAGVTVGVIDTGVQASVPDLRGVVVPGGDMLGQPGDGETDFSIKTDGHGTAVAALIAGQGYGTGTVGIAPQARILPVHAATPGVAGDAGILASGIEFAVNHGAQVVNVSLGLPSPSATTCDPVLQDAVAYALGRGAVVVAAAGDTNVSGTGPFEPASCPGVLAVGGVGPDGSLWADSTRQPYVSVAAPGEHVADVGRDGGYTATGAGTSASAPLVAGAAALIRSRYPAMPWYQVDQRLIATAVPAGTAVPNDSYGYGIIDPAKALNAAAYPVSSLAPDPPLAAFRTWLTSPDGRAWVQANSAHPVPSSGQAGAAASPSPGHSITAGVQAGSVAPASAAQVLPAHAAPPRRAPLDGLVAVAVPVHPLILMVLLAVCLAAVLALTLAGAFSRSRGRHARLS
jgi:membrane-anchored mycosin MYCP